MKKRSIIINIFVFIFCGVVIFAALNRNALLPYVWGAFYGKRMKWNEIEVLIGNAEYFRPLSSSGDLFIGNYESPNTFLILHAKGKSYEDVKNFVGLYCKTENCVRSTEKSYVVGDHRVVDFTFTTGNSGLIFQKYLIIENKNAWIEYIGSEERFVDHQRTIESVIPKLN